MAQDTTSTLTPLQLTAAAGVLQNQGIAPTTLNASIAAYTAQPVIAPLVATVNSGALSGATLNSLTSLASGSTPALGDSVPSAQAGSYPGQLMTTAVAASANLYLGNGDLSKFCQTFSTVIGYITLTNQYINSSVNAKTYLGPTFTNANDMVSGGITAVNLCTKPWGDDLANLGSLIDLSNLDEMGTPAALVKQVAKFGGITPEIVVQFTAAGVSQETVLNITNPELTISETDQKAMYAAMTKITGAMLTQTLSLLGVTTGGISTMADLLNPLKLFPNSYKTLTVTNLQGTNVNIYSGTSVNPVLGQSLPPAALNSIV